MRKLSRLGDCKRVSIKLNTNPFAIAQPRGFGTSLWGCYLVRLLLILEKGSGIASKRLGGECVDWDRL